MDIGSKGGIGFMKQRENGCTVAGSVNDPSLELVHPQVDSESTGSKFVAEKLEVD